MKRSQVEQKTRLVRDKDGREVVSSTTVYLEPGPHADPGSIVTVHTGKPAERTAKLITTEYMQHPQVGEYLAWRLE
ncbi:hypothetical protein D9V30_10225 [Mycetocola reblochoni]|uniref:Uncharacterized protein n=1 Tax=Mycetocola reblochoni TaxID=331618 RepID=A0A3L6ZK48_9MICO|nr:hypothetical protein [Mycetocola reblochoni]RLP68356.1 hypothetical protein D9V30_10225 [Mycetocola reblochoni]